MLSRLVTTPTTRHRLARTLLVPAILAGSAIPANRAEAIEFADVDIFFELNATDRDLGVHVALDAESWHHLRIISPLNRQYLEINVQGKLAGIGLTELMFEGEEPSLLEVPFRRFLALVPPGLYQFKGRTTEGQPLRSTDLLTAEIPCPVRIVTPAEDDEVAVDEAVISWQPAPGWFDPDMRFCDSTREVGLVGYQVIVGISNEEVGLHRELLIDLPPDATSVQVPDGFLDEGAALDGTEFKVEVLAIEDSGNKTITEREFDVEG